MTFRNPFRRVMVVFRSFELTSLPLTEQTSKATSRLASSVLPQAPPVCQNPERGKTLITWWSTRSASEA